MTFSPPHEDIIELALPDGDLLHCDDNEVYTSKLGGRPVWMTAPSKDLLDSLKCPLCKNDLFLLLQMDCPREEYPSVNRVVYIFVCNTRLCSQDARCWRVIFMMKQKEENVIVQDSKASKATFWDSLMSDEPASSDVKEEKKILSNLSNSKVEIPLSNPKNQFPGIYLHIDEEIIVVKGEKKGPSIPENVTIAPEAITSTGGEEEWSGEQYEKFRAPGTDKSFSKFQKRVAHYPRQCVRYVVSGTPSPLLYHDLDINAAVSKLPSCKQCNSTCSRYELQLMPAILAFLPTESPEYIKHIPTSKRSANPMISDGMEWGSVFVYSCSSFCGFSDWKTEVVEGNVIIQLELSQ